MFSRRWLGFSQGEGCVFWRERVATWKLSRIRPHGLSLTPEPSLCRKGSKERLWESGGGHLAWMVLLNLKNYCRGALNKDYEKIVVIRERLSWKSARDTVRVWDVCAWGAESGWRNWSSSWVTRSRNCRARCVFLADAHFVEGEDSSRCWKEGGEQGATILSGWEEWAGSQEPRGLRKK